MISLHDKVEVIGKIVKGHSRRARGWNLSQTKHLGQTGKVIGIREVRGKPDQFDVTFQDGHVLAYEELHLKKIEVISGELSL